MAVVAVPASLMLTVNQLPPSLPRSHSSFRRPQPTHPSHHSDRRPSLPHLAPSDASDRRSAAVFLRSHTEDEDEDEEDEDGDEEFEVQAESRERLAAFVSKETSGESSDEENDLAEEDDDSSSSASSSSSTPVLKPADSAVSHATKRTVTFHSSVSHAPPSSPLPPPATASVVHRKLVKPSSRQHKASPNHYSSHQAASKAHAVRLHRRKPHTVESAVLLLSDDTCQGAVSPLVSEQSECVTTAVLPSSAAATVDASLGNRAPLVPLLSVTRYALLVAILRRSDGRDKLIRTAYFGSNHLRALVHAVHNRLSHNSKLLSMLSTPSSSTSPVLLRLVAAAASFCQSADTHLDRLSEVLGAARQLLRFGRWVYDLQSLSEAWQQWKKCNIIVESEQSGERRLEQATAMLELINAFLSVLIDLMDDVEWLAEHRVLPASLSSPAGLASAVLWLTSVCIDIPFTLHTLAVMPSTASRDTERRAEQLSLLRYTGDLLYSGSLLAEHAGWLGDCDTSRWRVGDSGGLLSAVVSLYKLSRSETLHRSVH